MPKRPVLGVIFRYYCCKPFVVTIGGNLSIVRVLKFQCNTFFEKKIWLMKEIIDNVQSTTKSDPAIEIEPTT